LQSYTWWKARYATIHQRILTHPVQTLASLAESSYKKLEKYGKSSGELAARYHLECGLMLHANQASTQITVIHFVLYDIYWF
jgi:hypothetical protein